MNRPKYIIVHHTAVSYTKNADQYEATNRYHASLGWGKIGYHYEISKAGKIYKGREENEVGAHCYQQGMNYQSIGICLDGNFDVELPTGEQQSALKLLISDIMRRYSIPLEHIYPHRHFAGYKSCYGTKLASDWVHLLLKKKDMFTLIQKERDRDVYALLGNTLYLVSDEFTFKLGVEKGLWDGNISLVQSITEYARGANITLTPMDGQI